MDTEVCCLLSLSIASVLLWNQHILTREHKRMSLGGAASQISRISVGAAARQTPLDLLQHICRLNSPPSPSTTPSPRPAAGKHGEARGERAERNGLREKEGKQRRPGTSSPGQSRLCLVEVSVLCSLVIIGLVLCSPHHVTCRDPWARSERMREPSI